VARETSLGSHSGFRVALHEGRNREVRRLWEAVGFEVSRLMRVRYGSIVLPRSLAPGAWTHADASEHAQVVALSQGK
jgi:23S rRNA pseudouridine2605 synthase